MENVAKGEIGVDGKAAILHQGTENDAMNCPDLTGTESQLVLFEVTVIGTSADV